MTKIRTLAALLFMLVPMAANAGLIRFQMSVDGVDVGDLGFAGTDTGTLLFDFLVDESAFAASNTTVYGVEADISFTTTTTELFAIDGFVGPVSKTTIVENTATREIISYTGNPVVINGINFQLIAQAFWPEGFLPLESDYLPVDSISGSLSIWDTSLDRSQYLIRYSNLTGSADYATTVPEPGTLALLGIGLVGMALARRKKQV